MRDGISKTKAKVLATEKWDEQNPWFKAGSTHGKIAKSKAAAELRAAAAEKRLQALPGPSRLLEQHRLSTDSEEDELDVDSGEKRGEQDVEDPHLEAEERRRKMEEEMDEEEMEDLRGGWKEFVGDGEGSRGEKKRSSTWATATESVPGTSKRHLSPDPDVDARHQALSAKKASRVSETIKPAPAFDTELIRQEGMRALGLADTTSRKTERVVGGGSRLSFKRNIERNNSIGAQNRQTRVIQEDGPGWTCQRCTYVNLMDHGRCGKSHRPRLHLRGTC
jgi:hypothetical protein